MMNDQDIYDLQDFPEMYESWDFLVEIERLMTQRIKATMTVAEIAAAIIAAVERMDPARRTALRHEYHALLDHQAGRRPVADYEELKTDLDRVSGATRRLFDRMREDK